MMSLRRARLQVPLEVPLPSRADRPDRVRAHLPEWMLGEAAAPATPDWATAAATSIAPRDMPRAVGLQAA